MTTAAPLAGRTVLVTRGRDKGDRLGELLEALGARVVRVPLLAVERLPGASELRAGVERLGSADRQAWVVLTSETAARILLEQIRDPASLMGIGVATVGPATAAAVRAAGVEPAVVAAGQTSAALGGELVTRGVAGSDILVVAAAGGRDDAAVTLRAAGARVTVVEAYRSVLPDGAAAQLAAALRHTPPDAVTFTSGSTVAHFRRAAGDRPLPVCPAVCIGEVTAAAAAEAGWARVVVASQHTAAGLAEATLEALTSQTLP